MKRLSSLPYVSWLLVNLGIVALVVFALCYTKNLWSFIGLLFLFSAKASGLETKCPKCGHKFTAISSEKDHEN